MNTDLQSIKAALVTADEKLPLKEYTMRAQTPPKFPYEEYTLMPPEDARKIIKTLDALNERALNIKTIDAKYTQMRVQLDQKIKELQVVDGYEDIKQEMSVMRDRLATEVEQTMDKAGKVLLEYNNIVTTIFEQSTTKKPTAAQEKTALIEAIKKFASPKIAGQILEDVDKTIKAATEASTVVTRELASWPVPKDLRKKVKEEKPLGGSKTADIMENVKSFFTSFINVLKSAWTKVSDAVSSLAVSTNAAIPLLDEIKQLAGEAGFINIQASKKGSIMSKEINSIKAALGGSTKKTAQLGNITYETKKTAQVDIPDDDIRMGIMSEFDSEGTSMDSLGQVTVDIVAIKDFVHFNDYDPDSFTSPMQGMWEFMNELIDSLEPDTNEVTFIG